MPVELQIDPIIIAQNISLSRQGHSLDTKNGNLVLFEDGPNKQTSTDPPRRRSANISPLPLEGNESRLITDETAADLDQLPIIIEEALGEYIPLIRAEQDLYTTETVSTVTKISLGAIYRMARLGIVGQKLLSQNPQSAWVFTSKDVLILELIRQRGLQSSFKAREVIAEAIRSGRTPEEAFKESLNYKKYGDKFSGASLKTRKRIHDLKENLKTAMAENTLSESPKPLGVNRMTSLLRKHLQDAPGNFTLERLLKTAQVLGEESEINPEEARVNEQREWRYALTSGGVARSLETVYRILIDGNLTVEEAYQKAMDRLEEKRRGRVAVDEMVLPVLEAQGVSNPSPFRQGKTKNLLLDMLRGKDKEKRLPLPADLPLRECLLYGIPPEQTEVIAGDWARFIEESQKKPEKEPSIHEMMNKWSSLSEAIRTNLPYETKVDPRTVPYAAAWMKAKGVPVETISRKQGERTAFYYRLPPEEKMSAEQKEIWQAVFTDPEKMATLTRILEQGLSLEEILTFKKHFPDNFPFSITHAYWLATGERGCLGGAKKASVLKVLEKSGEVTVIKETTSTGKILHHVPFDQLEKAVAVLKIL